MKVYCLVSENLTGLGGPMGTERTWTNFRRYFRRKTKAKQIAQDDYNDEIGYKDKDKLRWIKDEKPGECRTKDLGFVMYHITIINIE
jgi:hypothetical protein